MSIVTQILHSNLARIVIAQLALARTILQPMAPWGLPAVLGAGWFVWPAISPSFKKSIGM